jgi:hypothetical protein
MTVAPGGSSLGLRKRALVGLLAVAAGCTSGPVDGPGEARLELTTVPMRGSHGLLHGRVTHVDPTEHEVAVYAYLGEEHGWWSRPSPERPTTRIRSSGNRSTDVTVEEGDEQAQVLAAFLVPSGRSPIVLEGAESLPGALVDPPPPHDARLRHSWGAERLLFFSGRTWAVRYMEEEERPGPNLWSDSHDAAWVDAEGRLHLALTRVDGVVHSAEVVLLESLGLGTYLFSIDSRVRQRNEFAVVGLFVRDAFTERENREFDIEFARWADPDGPDAQYVMAPWQLEGNGDRFTVGPLYERTIHACEWRQDRHLFTSALHHAWPPDEADVLRRWDYDGPSVMIPENERVRFSLWLFRHPEPPPGAGDDVELVVRRFDHLPPGVPR